jgi:hypothetical protein
VSHPDPVVDHPSAAADARRHKEALVMRRFLSILTAALAVIALTAAPVAARAFPFHGEGTDSNPEVVCGLDVTTSFDNTFSGRAFLDQDGNQVRFDLKITGTDTWTYAPTGLSVVWAYEVLYKNVNGVDNGDGTIEGDQTMAGKSTYYAPDGERLLTAEGPITIHLTIDFNVDPPLFESVVLSEHGSHPDICPAVVAALGA